uniref:DCB domain-containing protein n=1 Tax=Rhabditophanes sp. KR3021 TaxID=114890 RepID=A0AC35TQ81_9BILA
MLRSNIEIVEKLIDCLKTKVSHYKEHMLECLFYLVFPEDKSREDIKKNPKAEAYIKMNNDQLKKLKARFRELKGFNLMMDTFATENVEPILYHSSRIIGIFLSCVSFTECTKVFLESSVIIRMAEKLSHGSSRLLHECAKCISYALDSIGLPEPKVKIIIPKIVQMLGSDDPQFAQYLSRCLVSATINSVENKNIIMICNGIQGLLALLDKYKNVDNNNFKPIYDEIMDNSLIALKNLVRDKIDPSQKYKGIEIVSRFFIENVINLLIPGYQQSHGTEFANESDPNGKYQNKESCFNPFD